jgi:hypothetical protein
MTKVPSTELYLAEDGSLFKMNRLQGNGWFLTYSLLSCEELRNLNDLLCDNNAKRESKKAGPIGDQAIEPAADGIDIGGIYNGK